jgi:starvation-inducible DNA-binding protein
MDVGLNAKQKKVIADGLFKLLAETYAIYLKTQNFHWNVKGTEFFSLHLLFEKQYNELAEALDEIAERIRALDYPVDATFTALAKASSIKEGKKGIKAREMCKALAESNEQLIRHARHLHEIADEVIDGATVDLIARRLGAHEKAAWMLRSQG